MTGSYNNFFRVFDRNVKKDYTLEASRDVAKPKMILKPRKVSRCTAELCLLIQVFDSRLKVKNSKLSGGYNA